MMFINFIEAFIFPLFLAYYYELKNKPIFIIISGFIQFTVLNICSYYNQSGYSLTFFIILFNIITLFLTLKKFNFDYIVTVIIYNLLILSSNYLTIFLNSLLTNSKISIDSDYELYFLCILSKIFLSIITIIILKNKKYFSYKLDIKKWNSLLIFQATLVIAIAMAGYSIILNTIEMTTIVILTYILIILNFSFYSIINKIETLNKEKLEYQKQIQLEEFNKQTLMTMKNIKNEIDAIDHRLFYILLELEDLLKKNDTKKSIDILEKYKDLITKRHLSVETKNNIFDCLISLKINDMLAKDINVKTVIAISQKDHYNDLVLINFIISILSLVYNSEFIDISIQEIRGFLRISIVFDYSNIDMERLEEEILSMITTVKASHRIIKKEFCELRFGIALGEYE